MVITFLCQFIAACFGTIAFSILFFVPKENYPLCGMIGGAGWVICLFCSKQLGLSVPMASFVATAFVVMTSRMSGAAKRCPATLFLISGIFPLVPGTGIYRTIYYMIMGDLQQSADYGKLTLKVAMAIVLGIIFVFEIPQRAINAISGGK